MTGRGHFRRESRLPRARRAIQTPKRRGHGEGSIYQRADGRWCAAVGAGRDVSGKARRRYLYGKTRKEVQEALTQTLHDRQNGLPVDPERQTLGQFLTRWLEDSVKGSTAPKTHRSYEQIIRLHIAPILGQVQLGKLSPQHLQRLYRSKQEAGLGRTVRLIHAVLHRSLGQALKWGLVPRNVADAVDAPRVEKKPMQALGPEEASHLLDVAREDRLQALYAVAVTTGLREGELLALRWADIDLDSGTVNVQRNLQWLKGGYSFSEPKTSKSRRTVALPSLAVKALGRHRDAQAAERSALGDAWTDLDLVFVTEVGTPLNPSNVTKRSFHPLLEKAELPRIRFHDLRHTAASLLLAAGENPKVVQEMLGHSSITLTMDTYSHVIPSLQRQAAAKMDSLLTLKVKDDF